MIKEKEYTKKQILLVLWLIGLIVIVFIILIQLLFIQIIEFIGIKFAEFIAYYLIVGILIVPIGLYDNPHFMEENSLSK